MKLKNVGTKELQDCCSVSVFTSVAFSKLMFGIQAISGGQACVAVAGVLIKSKASLQASPLLFHTQKQLSSIMSDEEHHFDSVADAGASKTYPQQAGTIRKNGYIVIKGRPCKLEDIVPSSHNCDVPHVNRTDYQLIDISEDGFVSLLTDNGSTKDDLKLPTDDSLLTQIKDGFAEGKDLVVSVMSAMGEEQICALKDIGPKN
ncbi:eukaryotic translation initiation factor 5A-1 [Trifolium repens]|nr:eukaryotic translation initiation factor 5A-1 [Trifolium repens]